MRTRYFLTTTSRWQEIALKLPGCTVEERNDKALCILEEVDLSEKAKRRFDRLQSKTATVIQSVFRGWQIRAKGKSP